MHLSAFVNHFACLVGSVLAVFAFLQMFCIEAGKRWSLGFSHSLYLHFSHGRRSHQGMFGSTTPRGLPACPYENEIQPALQVENVVITTSVTLFFDTLRTSQRTAAKPKSFPYTHPSIAHSYTFIYIRRSDRRHVIGFRGFWPFQKIPESREGRRGPLVPNPTIRLIGGFQLIAWGVSAPKPETELLTWLWL